MLVSLGSDCGFIIGYQLIFTGGEVDGLSLVVADVLKLGLEEVNDLVSLVVSPEVSKDGKFDG